MSHIITVENLIKSYKTSKTPAVDSISFYVEPGSFFALLGPNGAGKTTTISILTTLLKKTSGQVTIAGLDLDKHQSAIRRQIGVIFQNPSLDRNLSAEENIRIHAHLYGVYNYRPSFALMPKAYKDHVLDLAKLLDIQKSIHQPISTFSGGMKRKLEIVRGLIHHPDVLFLDEPTTGIDPLSRKNLWDYLQNIRKEKNLTIFLTTHYLQEAESTDYLCIINHGRIVSKGTPNQIKSDLLGKNLQLDATNRNKLKEELTKKKIPFTGIGPYIIPFTTPTPQSIISHLSTPLTLLNIQNPSLEDAYLKIISEDLVKENL